MILFQAPARSATQYQQIELGDLLISIHAPARGATKRWKEIAKLNKIFQSTHPRGMRPGVTKSCGCLRSISIHAPARGATYAHNARGRQDVISIHAPARGATRYLRFVGGWLHHFNPRTREGCDHCTVVIDLTPILFQSTHPRGVRQKIGKDKYKMEVISIHAPARGATNHADRGGVHGDDFNPRTREGCDEPNPYMSGQMLQISIHAPARGATFASHAPPLLPWIFQSTHPRGVRPRYIHDEYLKSTISIHAPARGATHKLRNKLRLLPYFNPRTREGCDRFICPLFYIKILISIHAPARGATRWASGDRLQTS